MLIPSCNAMRFSLAAAKRGLQDITQEDVVDADDDDAMEVALAVDASTGESGLFLLLKSKRVGCRP